MDIPAQREVTYMDTQPTSPTDQPATSSTTLPNVTYVATPPAEPATTVFVTPVTPAPKSGNVLQRFIHDPTVVRFFKGAIVTALSAVLLYTVRVLPSLNLLSGTDLSLVVGLLLALEKELQLPQ
jgi:hypothetical protein